MNLFGSFDAFRAHCGEPTMPLEQCPICRKLPARCDKEDDATPPEIDQLEDFIEHDVRRCPTCGRLYFYESMSFGNDIYTGNDSTWHLVRCDAGVLFDMTWCVQRRLPDRDVRWISSDRFFANHVLVNFGSQSWGALDRRNQLVMLDSHEAIAKLIELDPPRVTGDVELAQRYALFIDELEHPEDSRPGYFQNIRWRDPLSPEEQRQIEDAKAATGLVRMLAPEALIDMPTVAERDGDRVLVRCWVTSQKRLICRVLTIEPTGRVRREDAVIAEDLPMR